MREPWRLEAVAVAAELLPLGAEGDDRPRWALDVARDYARGEASAGMLRLAHEAATASFWDFPNWSGTPAIAAEWVTAEEPLWQTETTPWKLLERARRVGPPEP